MSISEVRIRVRAIILAILGLLVFILVLRVIFDFLDASTSNILVSLVNNISDFLITPFEGIIESKDPKLNYDALISIGIYTLLGIALSEIITAFIYDSFHDILQNIVDAIFKVIEFVLILRIIFDFFLTPNSIGFVSSIRDVTDWANTLGIESSFLEGRLNINAAIVLAIVVILDFLTESLIDAIFKLFKANPNKKVVKTTMPAAVVAKPAPAPVAVVAQTQNPIPVQHNITVNLPPQQTIYQAQVRPIVLPAGTVQNGQAQRQAVPYNKVILQPTPPTNPAPNPQMGHVTNAGYTEYHNGKPVN